MTSSETEHRATQRGQALEHVQHLPAQGETPGGHVEIVAAATRVQAAADIRPKPANEVRLYVGVEVLLQVVDLQRRGSFVVQPKQLCQDSGDVVAVDDVSVRQHQRMG
jgi:uncharacterized protein YoaH (UPF0181 family)